MVFAWDPGQYLKFSADRLRPALELIARIPLEAPETVVDLGCGPGTVTRILAERWPDARITGLDSSPDMLAEARSGGETIQWVEGDAATWAPEAPVDLLFSNAALHWLDDHAALFPRLLDCVRPGGVLAVQMPNNFGQPSHTGIAETVRSLPWRGRLEGLLRPVPVAEPGVYYDLLAPITRKVEIWETTYTQIFDGEDPVVDWIRSTALAPFLEALGEGEERDAFLAAYAARMRAAYPRRADGRTLFPFRRLFLLAAV